jgi:hypothetical protein
LKKVVSKSVYKKIDKKIQNRFFHDFLFITYHVFGRFSVRGVQKAIKISGGDLTSPGTFLAPEEPTHEQLREQGGQRRKFRPTQPPVISGFGLPVRAAASCSDHVKARHFFL